MGIREHHVSIAIAIRRECPVDALHAGTDACRSAYRRKMLRYASILPALRRAGVISQPMVFSAEGRPHPATVRTMECTLRMVRARRGEEAEAELRARWRHEVAVAIQRRKAAMMRACLPDRTRRREWLACGGRLYDADGAGQLPTLQPDETEAYHEHTDAAQHDGKGIVTAMEVDAAPSNTAP